MCKLFQEVNAKEPDSDNKLGHWILGLDAPFGFQFFDGQEQLFDHMQKARGKQNAPAKRLGESHHTGDLLVPVLVDERGRVGVVFPVFPEQFVQLDRQDAPKETPQAKNDGHANFRGRQIHFVAVIVGLLQAPTNTWERLNSYF